jgi:lactate dehydrogenase-like 2-hydroxyacid dehydrogenase
MKIAFLDDVTLGSDVSLDPIREKGELILYGRTSEDEVDDKIAGCDVVITNKVQIRKSNIDKASSLKLICVAATGINNVDAEYAESKGIPVRNVAGYSTESVAQVTMMHILNLVGHGIYFDNFIKSGEYSQRGIFTDVSNPFFELKGKQIGIIAMGNIGRRVGELSTAFGMKVSYFSTSGTSHCTQYPSLSIERLLSESDIVSVHAPLNSITKNLITYNKMRTMKKSAYLVNVGRGGIVNEIDLVEALNDGLIAGAALDVYEKEPIPAEHPYLSRLKDKNKLILSPHIAWTSREARKLLIEKIAENIR